MTNLITREEYMKNSSELFTAFYSQFITDSTRAFINDNIGMDKIRASTCPHLNDVCKMSNGGAGNWTWDFTPFDIELARKAGAVSKNGLGSNSVHTSIGKVCAKLMLLGD